jgi:hypothetical protein
VVVGVAGYLLAVGARGARRPTEAGFTVVVAPAGMPLYRLIESLPADVMIAGWPDPRNERAVVDNVPYMSARRVLLSGETHQAFHEAYVVEMRVRMRTLIDAYFAADLEPLRALRDRLGVTHLVIDRGHYENPPTYFRPFDQWTAQAFSAGRARGFEVRRRIAQAQVFDDGTLAVLDLSRLP